MRRSSLKDDKPGPTSTLHTNSDTSSALLMPGSKVDWQTFHSAKRRWGVSLKALLYRARSLGPITDGTYRRGSIQLAEWGHPEPGPLGPPE